MVGEGREKGGGELFAAFPVFKLVRRGSSSLRMSCSFAISQERRRNRYSFVFSCAPSLRVDLYCFRLRTPVIYHPPLPATTSSVSAALPARFQPASASLPRRSSPPVSTPTSPPTHCTVNGLRLRPPLELERPQSPRQRHKRRLVAEPLRHRDFVGEERSEGADEGLAGIPGLLDGGRVLHGERAGGVIPVGGPGVEEEGGGREEGEVRSVEHLEERMSVVRRAAARARRSAARWTCRGCLL